MLGMLKRAAAGSVLETRPGYRTAIGVLGVLLPPIVAVSSLVQGEPLQSSISAYYYTSARDWFVGILWVIGVFLFFYHYQPKSDSGASSQWQPVRSGAADSWLGKVAGICAVAVALFPTAPPTDSAGQPPVIGWLHGFFAFALFACLALFPLLLFSQSSVSRRAYRTYGWTMIVVLGLVVAYAFAPEGIRVALASLKPILLLETALIWVFGLSWFHKGRQLAASPNPAAASV